MASDGVRGATSEPEVGQRVRDSVRIGESQTKIKKKSFIPLEAQMLSQLSPPFQLGLLVEIGSDSIPNLAVAKSFYDIL